MSKKILKGIITSTKSAKTLIVNVPSLKEHSKYKKRFTRHKKYKAHYETGEYKVGDKVLIEESRPISKDKRWKVIGLVLENKSQKETPTSLPDGQAPEGRGPDSSDDVEGDHDKTEESLNKEI